MNELRGFYEKKKVVVTGGAGFVGSYLVEILCDLGARVVVMDNLSRGENFYDGRATYLTLDAANTSECIKVFEGAFAIFNLAAQVAGVSYNQSHHLEMLTQNTALQTAPVLAAASVGVPNFLQVSSVCVYGEREVKDGCPEHLLVEQMSLPSAANRGYSWSKRFGEMAAQEAALSIEKVVIVRPTNIYGPRDLFKPPEKAHVIPALIHRILSERGDVLRVNGTGEEVRHFLYVLDAAAGMVYAMRFASGRVSRFNLAPPVGKALTINDLAQKIIQLSESNKRIEFTKWFDSGDKYRVVKATRIYNQVGWRPLFDLEAGLKQTIDYYRELMRKNA